MASKINRLWLINFLSILLIISALTSDSQQQFACRLLMDQATNHKSVSLQITVQSAVLDRCHHQLWALSQLWSPPHQTNHHQEKSKPHTKFKSELEPEFLRASPPFSDKAEQVKTLTVHWGKYINTTHSARCTLYFLKKFLQLHAWTNWQGTEGLGSVNMVKCSVNGDCLHFSLHPTQTLISIL